MTQADLAERAGLSYRTVLDLERGRRERVQVKTLMLLSGALDISYDELRGDAVESNDVHDESAGEGSGDGRKPVWRRPGPLIAAALALVVVVAGLIVLGNVSPSRYELMDDKHRLVARDDLLGIHCWSRDFEERIRLCQVSPWSDDVVLVGLFGDTAGGGGIMALDRETGDPLWTCMPDVEAIARAFGEEIAYSANYSCTGLATPDLDGDGVSELVARFCNAKWYPNALCFIDADGRLTSQYSHKGHLYVMHVEDLDDDGKDELVVGGTNNTKAYQGATVFVLDETHRSGASVDAEAAPSSTEPDSALCRVVFPQLPEPYMQQLGHVRLATLQIKTYRNARDDLRLSVAVGAGDAVMLVETDRDLRPLSSEISDGFLGVMGRDQWPDSLVVDTGPGDEAWRTAWVDSHLRFEAGHWPPLLQVDDR